MKNLIIAIAALEGLAVDVLVDDPVFIRIDAVGDPVSIGVKIDSVRDAVSFRIVGTIGLKDPRT